MNCECRYMKVNVERDKETGQLKGVAVCTQCEEPIENVEVEVSEKYVDCDQCNELLEAYERIVAGYAECRRLNIRLKEQLKSATLGGGGQK